jgi:hypothetical protein
MSTPPLLMIAEGRKPRPRRALVIRPKELALHIAVATVLKDRCLPDWRWTHIPAGEARDARHAAKLRAMGVVSGWPDFILVSPYGSIRCLELKRQGETLSDEQDVFWRWALKHSVPHAIAYSIDDALRALDHWGCLRKPESHAP